MEGFECDRFGVPQILLIMGVHCGPTLLPGTSTLKVMPPGSSDVPSDVPSCASSAMQ